MAEIKRLRDKINLYGARLATSREKLNQNDSDQQEFSIDQNFPRFFSNLFRTEKSAENFDL